MKKIDISLRLKEITQYIDPSSFFADIGSDHAHLPTFVCLNDLTARAIAGEVNQGPFNNAKEVVRTYDLCDRIDVRLGDGLAVLEKDVPDTLIIAGMGGKLIKKIILNDIDKTKNINKLILQPNLDADKLRAWFIAYNYTLVNEKMIEENGHFYEVLVAEKTTKNNVYDNTIDINKQIYFGPLLLKERSLAFIKKWSEEKNNLQRIINDMQQAKEINDSKLTEFKTKLKWIEEVLNHE